ncbi:hypothetical protein SLA2020_009670 [Shorea laevis]
MVAISLYRGNLHRAPDVPRRWLMPTRNISLKDFKILLQRRNKALSRLHSAASSNPNPDSVPQIETHVVDGSTKDVKVGGERSDASKPEVQAAVTNKEGESYCNDCSEKPVDEPELKPVGEPELKIGDEPELKPCNEPELKPVTEGGWAAEGERDVNLQQVVEKPAEEGKTIMETIDKVDELNEKVKRKREVEEKLQILNSKKHNLVQVLKQILNVEEELKRRNSMQGMAMRAAVPLQVEVPNDSGSMSRQVTPRVGSEANLAGENGGGDADDVSNHNVQSHHMFRMSSTSPSPSSESPLRRLPYIQHNVLPHPARASMAVIGSPSRFALAITQGPGNLPTASVSGTSYIASSPSPAASGGTSVFRDARQPSPWN